jgi:cytochrome c-type biogenesis protein CcmH
MKALLSILLLALFAFGAQAREAVPLADDEAVEQRLIAIAEELRCLVCQNESLAGSRAELAQDLRREIRTLIKAGKTDPEILDFLVSRYGDFVRYRPPFKPSTWLLWTSPFAFMAIGIGALSLYLRRRARVDAQPLSAADKAKAAALLAGEN